MEHAFSHTRRSFLALAGTAAVVPLVDVLAPQPGAAATPATRPNILLFLTDEERQTVTRPTGFKLPTRDYLTATGMRFTMHHTPTTPCSPARAAIFTGQHAPSNGVTDNCNGGQRMSIALPNLGNQLKAAGYHTAYAGKWHLGDVAQNNPSALQPWGFDESMDILGGGGPNEGSHDDSGIAAKAASWLTKHRQDTQPWLLVVSLINPHDIMWCPNYYTFQSVPAHGVAIPDNFESDRSKKPTMQTAWAIACQWLGGGMPNDVSTSAGIAAWQKYGNWYLDLLERTDQLMGQVVTALRAAPQVAGSTVIVHLADHGELGGAHGLRQKGAMIYKENLRVPLVICDPRRPASQGRSTAALTSHIDVVPTICALTGSPAPVGPGKSLVPLIDRTKGSVREGLLVTVDSASAGLNDPYLRSYIRGVITPQYSYGRYSTPATVNSKSTSYDLEVYDRSADPREIHNLGWTTANSSLISSLNDLTDQLISSELQHV